MKGASRSGPAALLTSVARLLDCLPNTSPFLKQRPHSIRTPVIWDRGRLHVQKDDKPGEKASQTAPAEFPRTESMCLSQRVAG